MSTAIRCPHCSRRYAVAETALGKPVTCTNCKNRFQAEPENQTAVSGSPAKPPAAKPAAAPRAPAAAAPADLSSSAYNVFADDDLMSSAAAAPALARPKPSGKSSGDAPKAKKGKKGQGSSDEARIRTYQDEEGCWYAQVSQEQIFASPATWLMAVATAIGVLMLLLHFILPLDKSFVILTLGGGGVAWLAGFVILQDQYYKKWSDFAERKLTTAEAPAPGWMKLMEYVPLGTVMIAGFFIMHAAETEDLKTTAYQICQSMSNDKAAVKAAIEEYHNDCWSEAQEGFGRRQRTNKQTYLDAMRARMQARFARRGSLPLPAVAWDWPAGDGRVESESMQACEFDTTLTRRDF